MNIINSLEKKISFFLLFFLIAFFIYGFLVGENSAGAGGYNVDLLATFSNLQLFINNNILQSIKLTADNNLYYSNRPPLLYILHSSLNPFASDLWLYRLSVFFISCLVPGLYPVIPKSKELYSPNCDSITESVLFESISILISSSICALFVIYESFISNSSASMLSS
jgi:hypothetical protein